MCPDCGVQVRDGHFLYCQKVEILSCAQVLMEQTDNRTKGLFRLHVPIELVLEILIILNVTKCQIDTVNPHPSAKQFELYQAAQNGPRKKFPLSM